MTANPRKRPQKKAGKVYAFNLSMAGLVSVALAGAAALTAFFALGVLVGRGYQPEKAVPKLAEFMNQAHQGANRTPAPMVVLKAEELGYRERLRQDEPDTARPADKTEKKAGQNQTEAPPREIAQSAQAAPRKPAKEPDGPAVDAPAADGGPAFDYVYQAAAFTDLERAMELHEQVRSLGLTPSIQQAEVGERTWFRVMVLFQGRPAQTRGLKEKLSTIGVDEVIMKSKTPL
ncbi:MAG: SPOR domain-containing protein [Desulfovibrionaceae bacterium]